jgi:hypothetical protein
MKRVLAWADEQAERLARSSQWVRTEPRRRRRWAFVLTLFYIAIAAFGWSFSKEGDDSAIWVAALLTSASLTVLVWGLALNPKAAIKWAMLLMPLVPAAALPLAFFVSG